MECRNHAGVEAVSLCSGCQEAFCSLCLVDIGGKQYCGSCKVMAVKGDPGVVEAASIPCKEANEALTYAIIGIFICGPILEPIALVRASKAKKMIDANPQLLGSGKVAAARIIAVVALVLWVIGMFARLAAISHAK